MVRASSSEDDAKVEGNAAAEAESASGGDEAMECVLVGQDVSCVLSEDEGDQLVRAKEEEELSGMGISDEPRRRADHCLAVTFPSESAERRGSASSDWAKMSSSAGGSIEVKYSCTALSVSTA